MDSAGAAYGLPLDGRSDEASPGHVRYRSAEAYYKAIGHLAQKHCS